MNQTQNIAKLPFHLAPMAGVTDASYRIYMKELGADVVISELISSEGYTHGSLRTRDMLKVHEAERPVGLQIFGGNPAKMAETARYAEAVGADFVDLNYGCPVPKVVKNGAGSALVRDICKGMDVARAVRQAIRIPLSIKIRTGWDDNSINAVEFAKAASNEGVDWLSIHGRTREQGYSGLANWPLIETIAENSPIPIVGNGDIFSAPQALTRLKKCSAVMIGRAALVNPWIFLQCQAALAKEVFTPPPVTQTITRLKELVQEYVHPKTAPTRLKKLLVWFAAGIPGKAQFRKDTFAVENDLEHILELALEFFNEEAFLLHKASNDPCSDIPTAAGHG